MKVFLYKSRLELQLLVIFVCSALVMATYEFVKEMLFEDLDPWESHLITIFVTAAFATIAAVFMRRLINKLNEQLNIAAVAFESQDGMLVTDARKRILRVNSAFTQITGYTEQESIGKTPKILRSGLHDAAFYEEMWGSIRRTGGWQGEIYNRRKNGEIYPERLSISAVKDASGKVSNYVGVLVDETVRNLAFYDALTHLPNRRLLNDRVSQAMVASKRNGHYGAVMFLDLDNFKPLNDNHGHDIGDLLLIEVAKRISACVREMDTVARLGGDEFVVVLRELTANREESTRQAAAIAEKIRTTLALPYVLTIQPNDQIEHRCSSSIGVVLFNDHETGAEEVLKQADLAMYRAKKAGRNTVSF